MKFAVFNLAKSMGRLSYSFVSIEEHNNDFLLNVPAFLKGNLLFVLLDEDIENLEQIFNCSNLEVNDKTLYLDELDISNSFIGSVSSIDRYGTIFSGNRIFIDFRELKSDRVSKLFGKSFSIFKLS